MAYILSALAWVSGMALLFQAWFWIKRQLGMKI